MGLFWTLYRKELAGVVRSPLAYAMAAVFTFLMAYTFCAQLFHTRSANIIAMLYQAATLLLLIVPLVSMRQVAEERARGTLELLLSAPASDAAIISAKYLASLSVAVALLGLTLILPASLTPFAEPDWGPVFSGYCGLVLLASALCALGLAVSSCSPNQTVAAVVGMGLFLTLWMAETLGIYLPDPFDDLAISLSFDARLSPFAAGLIYLSDVGFFISITLLGLLITAFALRRD